jgi:DNA repair exonuclease SbcCD ATPase subunit
MNAETIKTLIDSLYVRLASYDRTEVSVTLLAMSRGLLERSGVVAGEQLAVFQEQLQKTQAAIKVLSEKENELSQKASEFQTLKNKIEQLRQLEQENSPEVVDRMAGEYKELEARLGPLKNKKEQYEKLLKKIKALNAEEESSIQQVSAKIIEVLDKRTEACVELRNEHQNKIIVFKESADALLRMEEDNREILAHINENSYVLEKFREAGFVKEGDASQKVDELAYRAREILDAYDGFLGNLLELAKKEQDEITRRQKTVREYPQ